MGDKILKITLPVSWFESDEFGLRFTTDSGNDVYLNPGDVIAVEVEDR